MGVPPEKILLSDSSDRVPRATAILKLSPVGIYANLGRIYGLFFKRDPSCHTFRN